MEINKRCCAVCDSGGRGSLDKERIMMYKIIRMYQSSDHPTRTIKTGLTLDEAQAHCQDPETSSSTATGEAARRRTRKYGPWFDGYEET